MPYVLASGFFRPRSPQAVGLLQYMLSHGSASRGLVRFQPHTGVRNPGYQLPGRRRLRDGRRPLPGRQRPARPARLSLYGKLGAGDDPGHLCRGRGLDDRHGAPPVLPLLHRPPNSAGSNAFFLETLRLTLVHETTDELGILAAWARVRDPRAWLRSGRIVVRRAPTSFGFLSDAIDTRQRTIHAWVKVPRRLATERAAAPPTAPGRRAHHRRLRRGQALLPLRSRLRGPSTSPG